MDPSRLCDLLAPGSSAEAFFVPSLGGEIEGKAAALSSLRSLWGGGGQQQANDNNGGGGGGGGCGVLMTSERTTVVGRYVDGKQAMATLPAGGSQEEEGQEGMAAAAGSLLPLEPTTQQVEAEVERMASGTGASSKPRDPFLRGDLLATRVRDMSLGAPPGHRLSLPPPPLGSTDIRVYGAKCLESQVCIFNFCVASVLD